MLHFCISKNLFLVCFYFTSSSFIFDWDNNYRVADAEEAAAGSGEGGEDGEDDGELVQQKNVYGVGGVNRPVTKPQNRKYYTHCPIHIAIQYGHKVLWSFILFSDFAGFIWWTAKPLSFRSDRSLALTLLSQCLIL